MTHGSPRPRAALLGAALCLPLAGCFLGTSTETVLYGSAARELFDRQVYPALAATCGVCHLGETVSPPGFVAVEAADGYELILASPVVGDFTPVAPLVAVTADGRHPGFTQAGLEAVLHWFAVERAAREQAAPGT